MVAQIVGYLYTGTLIGLAFYALHIIALIMLYLHHRRERPPVTPQIPEAELPVVTVQIPLRNERYVARRILAAVAAFDWPRERLEIQVLDDSDDDTTALLEAEVERLQAEGYDIHLLHRAHPTGHKAGALAAGLRQARGEYVAIFDADFAPAPDFLRRTVPHLIANPRLGFVQTRWGHLNAEYSLVTRAQALALDAHFTVEHIARNRSGLLMNFNGTAGVWRRRAIEEAGGWQHDTVAEDLDLSYRAQLVGWQVLYLPDVVAPAELPPLVAAFRQQQYRWAKGATQVLRKLSGTIVRSPRLKFSQKVMALLHLSGYLTQPLILMLVLLSAPLALYTPHVPVVVAALGMLTMLPPLLYVIGQAALYRDWPRRILVYPFLMVLGIGISWNTTLGVLDGWLHRGGEFKRTPKFELRGRQGNWRETQYRIKPDKALPGEIIISVYALTALILAYKLKRSSMMPFSIMTLLGEALMLWGALQQLPGRFKDKKEQGR
ncbi:MAG TPA: glycosyltransferase [Anaerolineae bacterium]|nr:glycosyltransferase [Anaerolineae bacterium]HQK14060.1 glycosyltransferase [Anaerolineae bacterium]